jgi:hypothetical protein
VILTPPEIETEIRKLKSVFHEEALKNPVSGETTLEFRKRSNKYLRESGSAELIQFLDKQKAALEKDPPSKTNMWG